MIKWQLLCNFCKAKQYVHALYNLDQGLSDLFRWSFYSAFFKYNSLIFL